MDALTAQSTASAATAPNPFVAILFAEAAQVLDKPSLMHRAVDHLNAAVAGLENGPAKVALYGGLCGIGWLTGWLRERLSKEPAVRLSSAPIELQDASRAIDKVLTAALGGDDEPHFQYDLLSGLVGVGVYALQRYPAPAARTLVQSVLARLERTAVKTPEGLTWLTPPEHLPPHIRTEAPAGLYNVGVAHGVPGIIALLGHMYSAGSVRASTAKLADGAVAWTLRQQLSYGDGARFPNWIVPGSQPEPARMAWCYGGLGLSAAIMIAGRRMGRVAWQSTAVRLAMLESKRDPARTGVRDASLCHGAVGNGLIFQRFHAATGERCFYESAQRCFEVALQMWNREQGIGGYRFLNGEQPSNDASFLSGSAGVALGLLAAASSVPPSWDRLLLTDIPSR